MTAAGSNEPFVEQQLENRVLWLTLNRAERRNPLSLAMMDALQTALDEAAESEESRVIVLAAKGPVFSAGHDLAEMQAGATKDEIAASQREILTRCTRLMLTIVNLPKPVIASVGGLATAGGCQLVSSCDIVMASEEARFCTPGVNVGGFCTTPLVAVSRKISRNHAMELALTGDTFSAEDAMRYGLVNRIFKSGELHDKTQAFAEAIAAKSALAIATGKQAFYRQVDMPIEEAYGFAIEKMIETGTTADAAEGTAAFFEKRKPKWTGS